MKKLLTAIFAVFAALAIARAQSDKVEKVTSLRIDADVRPAVGQFVPGDDDVQHLAYELLITNWHEVDLRLVSIDVEDAATGKQLVRFDSKALEDPNRIGTVPFSEKSAPVRVLRSGRTAVMTVDLKLPLGASVPAAVRHRIEFESNPNLLMTLDDGSESSKLYAFSEPMPIDRRPPLVIGAPLRGGTWACSNGFKGSDPNDGHYAYNAHEALFPSGKIARMHVTQRFGCDLAKVDAGGSTWRTPTPANIPLSAFYGYGADVIAVVDARVIKTQDGIPENVPRTDGKTIMPVPLTDTTVAGNMIALEIGREQYAFYAHLQPGSIRVKVGDRVRKGQLLGKVGNSGNTNGPHLHFHVGRGPAINGSDFLPYIFRSYWLSGHWTGDPAKPRRIEFKVPTNGSRITFPSR